MKLQRIDKVDHCTGCSACGDICPKGAISFKKKNDGFYYPVIDNEKCINCGLCYKICPRINKNSNHPIKGFVSYSLNRDIYLNSASGGIFSELAKYVLSKNGIVYGAAFDGMKVKHIRIDSMNDIIKLQKSKYIQSDTRGIFKKCRDDLNNDKIVLFSGVPCQISALNNYLGKKYKNLYTCDLVCHGVPSQNRFDEFIDFENKRKHGKIISFQFRKKMKKNTSSQTYYYEIKKNKYIKKKSGNYYDFPYLLGFQKYLFLRDSCYDCNYANMERCSDLTLGDYWDLIYKYNKPKGLSMVLINTKKGEKLFEEIKDSIYIESVDINTIQKSNECLNHPSKPSKQKEAFDLLYLNNKEAAINKFLIPKKRLIMNIYYTLPFKVKKIIKNKVKNDKLKKMW